MAKKAKAPNPFTGRWRIISMDQWDQDFVDAEVEGFFEFGSDNLGSFPVRLRPGRHRLPAGHSGREAKRRVLLGGE